MNKAQAAKVENEEVTRKFKVEGEYIVMHEEIKHDIYFEPREFISLYRNLLNNKVDYEHQLSQEYQERIKENIKQINKDINKMGDLVSEAENLLKRQYEEREQESMFEAVKYELSKGNEANIGYLKAIKPKLWKETLKKLTKNELNKLNRLTKK